MSGEHDRYPSLRITGLGNFAIEYLVAHATAADNEPQYSSVAEHLWRGRKQAQTVLKVLLCRPRRRAPREVLQEAIWPHGKGDSAETAFNAIISVLRHVLNLPITQKPFMHNNQPTDALMFLQDAQQLTTQSDTTIICSWLAAIKAESYAYLNDTQAAVKAINRSEYIVAQSASGEDTYATGFNLSRLSGYKGSCFVQLHQPEAALQALNEAFRLLDPLAIRRKSTILTDIAVAYTQLDGGFIKACELANQALEITLQTKSLSVLQRIRALRRKLEPWEFTTEVKELDDFLTTTFTAINS